MPISRRVSVFRDKETGVPGCELLGTDLGSRDIRILVCRLHAAIQLSLENRCLQPIWS